MTKRLLILPAFALACLCMLAAGGRPAAALCGDPTGDGDFQLSLAGLGYDGLEALADHLFYTGTLSAIPELPFVAIEDEEDESPDALDLLAAGGLPEGE